MATEEDDSYLYEDLYGGAEDGIAGLADSTETSLATTSRQESTSGVSEPAPASGGAQPQPIPTFDSESFGGDQNEAQQQSTQINDTRSRFQGPYSHPVGGISVAGKAGERPMNVRPSEMPDEGQVHTHPGLLLAGFYSRYVVLSRGAGSERDLWFLVPMYDRYGVPVNVSL
jgi:hypothetical protein